jgi:hypothetical protein
VVDATSHVPLAFVSIRVQHTQKGTVTDIDGRFSLNRIAAPATLQVSHVGYLSQYPSYAGKKDTTLLIFLQRDHAALNEVVVSSGLNPAHRIIKLAQENRQRNDPYKQPSFSYHAYTVAAMGAEPYLWSITQQKGGRESSKDSARFAKYRAKHKPDTSGTGMDSIIARRMKDNYLFLTESYTERIYRSPGLSRETVLATRVSGMKNPSFSFTSADFQVFGFYQDYIKMLDEEYANPIINGSISMYKFNLREMIPHEKDSTYVISFEPQKGKNFKGLKGTLYINTDGYAIENIIATPADGKVRIMDFLLQQKYERVKGRWFPTQLNTRISYKEIKKDSAFVYWNARSYISHVTFDSLFHLKNFSDVAIDFVPGAGKHTDRHWDSLRTDTLQAKEKATYETFAMLPKEVLAALNTMNSLIEIAGLQAIPAGKIDIPLKDILSGVNGYEKLRVGIGFQTNPLFSQWFSAGLNTGYGTGDHAWKYGGNLTFTTHARTNTRIRFSFRQDLEEPGNLLYFKQNDHVLSGQSLRNLYASRMDSLREWKFSFTTRPIPSLQADAWLLNEERQPALYDLAYPPGPVRRKYINTEAGIGLRFTRGENYTSIGRSKLPTGIARTQLMVQLTKGLQGVLQGELAYTRVALQFNQSFRLKKLGLTSLELDANHISGPVPYSYLFNAKASGGQNRSLYVANTFQTVGIYEFAASRSVSLFLQHNFENLLLKPRNPAFRPEFILVQNISFGNVSPQTAKTNIPFKTAEKGLFETGLQVNNIYRVNIRLFYLGIGGGVFYRYGPYALPGARDNYIIKTGISISF